MLLLPFCLSTIISPLSMYIDFISLNLAAHLYPWRKWTFWDPQFLSWGPLRPDSVEALEDTFWALILITPMGKRMLLIWQVVVQNDKTTVSACPAWWEPGDSGYPGPVVLGLMVYAGSSFEGTWSFAQSYFKGNRFQEKRSPCLLCVFLSVSVSSGGFEWCYLFPAPESVSTPMQVPLVPSLRMLPHRASSWKLLYNWPSALGAPAHTFEEITSFKY